MIYEVFSIKDLKTGYLPPTFDINELSAMRNFEHACYNPDSLFYTHGSDYQLWKIGTFNTDNGEFISESKFIMDAPIIRKED